MRELMDQEPNGSAPQWLPGHVLPAPLANLLAAFARSPERAAALRPQRQGPSLTLPSPDVRPGEPVRNPLAGFPREPDYVHPDVAQQRLDEAMFAPGFAGGIRPVARANTGAIRYNMTNGSIPPDRGNSPPAPPRPPGPPEGSNASAFPAVDPEGRHLTAPWRAGRTSDGSFSPLPSDAREYLLDDLAQRGVARDVPGDARMPRQVADELGRFLSAGGARVGSQAERNELFAEGLGTYPRNPELIWTRAPRAAAYFRSLVNTDEFLSRYFQLQGAAGLTMGAGAGLLGAGEGEAQ